MSVKVYVNKFQIREAMDIVSDIAKQRFCDNRLAIGEEFVQICTKYVPFDEKNETETHLAYSGHAYISGKDELKAVWSRTKKGFDVANAQYYGAYNHTPPREGHWDQAAMYYEGETFRKRVEAILNDKRR